MSASSFDLMSLPGAKNKRRRLSLRVPRVKTGPFGGGVGLLVIVVGLIAIGIGWNGMAGAGGQVGGQTDFRAQLPWLISGGILGLALVVFGAALIVVHNARQDRARLEAKLDELISATTRTATATAAVAQAPATVAGPPAGQMVAGGTTYHLPTCRLVQGRDDTDYVTTDQAASRGLRPCRVCKPAEADTLSR
jgi:hypothetical protein